MKPVKEFRPVGADNRFRENRFRLFSVLIDEVLSTNRSCKILDIGGVEQYWTRYGGDLDWSRIKVCLVNLAATPSISESFEVMIGDARCLDQFADRSFDIVHSNSVIEHVGRWADIAAMAREVRRLAPRYFVQTPYFWFPIEPHARFPFLHWMPEFWRYRILMRRACGFWQRQPDLGRAVTAVQSANMLDKQQMRFLFPDAEISFERLFGLPKSLMAIRHG